MFFDDEKLAIQNFGKMREAYAEQAKKKGFVFVSLNTSEEEAYLHEVMELFDLIKGCLLSLSGFLGTGGLYNLNEKHILKMNKLFGKDYIFEQKTFSHDKTKCFLMMISLENNLTNKLLSLASASSHGKEIFEIIKERTSFLSSLFKTNSIIS